MPDGQPLLSWNAIALIVFVVSTLAWVVLTIQEQAARRRIRRRALRGGQRL